MRRILGAVLLLFLAVACSSGGDPPPPGGGGTTVSFQDDIFLPLITPDCLICHGGAFGLSLETYEDLMAGGNSGAVVIPGDPDASLLVRRLEGTFGLLQMPLDLEKWTQPEIDRVRLWIQEGANDN